MGIVEHYHAEISLPACMPEWEEIYTTATEAVADLRLHCDWNEEEEEVDIRIVSIQPDPFLAVARWKGKPSTLNCYAYSCDEEFCNERLSCLEETYA
jgi:hypothetical protein